MTDYEYPLSCSEGYNYKMYYFDSSSVIDHFLLVNFHMKMETFG